MGVRGFGDLEAVVMDRIWNRDPDTVTVREIFEELSRERRIAYTTVMSTMDNLHTKGWLERERDGRAYRYWAIMTREERTARLMREALDDGGRSELVLSYFIEQIGPTESDSLRDALRRLSPRTSRTKKRWRWFALSSTLPRWVSSAPRSLSCWTPVGGAPAPAAPPPILFFRQPVPPPGRPAAVTDFCNLDVQGRSPLPPPRARRRWGFRFVASLF